MRVLKFGGTSLANPERFLQAAQLIEQTHLEEQAAAVLSAPAKITNHLVALSEKAALNQPTDTHFNEALEIFYNIINGLHEKNNKFDLVGTKALIDAEFAQIAESLQAIRQAGKLEDAVKATIDCRGEKLSIAMMKAWFEACGYEVTLIDPVQKLVAYGSYLESSVDIEESTKRMAAGSIPKKNVVLMAGFTAGNEKGELVLLGRNGSDYSAACLAACLGASACEIWTDVDGVFTCDPRLVPDARLLPSLSYREAMELSYFGAKVIHPRTIGPLVQTNIPCLIKNTANPTAPGSVINSNEKTDEGLQVKGITNLDNVAMFNVSGPGMQGMVGMAARVFSCMSKAGVSVILITQSSSEYSISFCVPSKLVAVAKAALDNEFASELQGKDLDSVEVIEDLSIISVVGDGMKQAKGIAARFFSALAQANISIVAIAQGSSERSISAVVAQNKAIEAVKSTHQALFNNKKVVDMFLVGVGGVGGELIKQIKNQKEYLAKKDIEIRVCALANSNKMLLNEGGLSLDNWQTDLENATQPSDFDVLLSFIKLHLQNLLAAGDEVLRFNGILSGSLSYIFGLLEEGKTLSEATALAREKGFTEPDPRDDLSGQDVARKLLILARETGLQLELSDVEVEGVLPQGFAEGKPTAEFMAMLPQLDDEFKARIEKAQAQGKVLRYVGQIENGKCKVSIMEVDGDDPLYKVKNGENALAFYTRYYQPIPLLLRGYGAGNAVTAAGIFADILRTLQH